MPFLVLYVLSLGLAYLVLVWFPWDRVFSDPHSTGPTVIRTLLAITVFMVAIRAGNLLMGLAGISVRL